MSDEYAVISIAVMTPDGSGAYRLWGIPRDRAEALVADLGEPHQEVLQTASERAASNALVATFETPPLDRLS